MLTKLTRYNVECHDNYDMTPAPNGMWVLFDDVVAEFNTSALQAEPMQSWQLERMRHIANEWADMATNGLQWLRNIVDGTSEPAEALSNMRRCLEHCRAVNDAPGLYGSAAAQQAEPQPTAELSEDEELEAWRSTADVLLGAKSAGPSAHTLRRAAFLLQNAYLFAVKVKESARPQQPAPGKGHRYIADMEDTLRQIADAFALPHGQPDLLIAAAKATMRAAKGAAQSAHPQQPAEPTVYWPQVVAYPGGAAPDCGEWVDVSNGHGPEHVHRYVRAHPQQPAPAASGEAVG